MAPQYNFHINLPALSGYCDHVDIKHDGDTLWAIADVNPTIKIYKWIPSEFRWIEVFDLIAANLLPMDYKLGLGHSIEVGPYNVHLVYVLKHQQTNETIIRHLGIIKSTL